MSNAPQRSDALNLLFGSGAVVKPNPQLRSPALGAPARRMTPGQARAVARKMQRATAPEEPAIEPTADEKQYEEFADTWGGSPQMEDQYKDPKYAGTWRESAVQVAVFDVLKPEELTQLNALLEEAEPPGAPRLVVLRMTAPTASPVADAMRTVLCYRRIMYRDLLKKVATP